jgi:hypothetical protein
LKNYFTGTVINISFAGRGGSKKLLVGLNHVPPDNDAGFEKSTKCIVLHEFGQSVPEPEFRQPRRVYKKHLKRRRLELPRARAEFNLTFLKPSFPTQ